MNNSRKGMEKETMMMIFLVLAFIVTVGFLFGPNSLARYLRDDTPDPKDIISEHPIYDPETSYTADFIQQARDMYSKTVKAFKDLAASNSSVCFYELQYETFDTDAAGKYDIVLKKDGTDTNIYLITSGKDAYEDLTAYSTAAHAKIEGVIPCTVRGGGASTFKSNWLGSSPKTGELPTDFITENEIILSKHSLYVNGGYKTKYDWETQDWGKYLFYLHEKNGQKFICVFPTSFTIYDTCKVTDDEVLSSDCFDGNDNDATLYSKVKNKAPYWRLGAATGCAKMDAYN